jgi:hypothetical protein
MGIGGSGRRCGAVETRAEPRIGLHQPRSRCPGPKRTAAPAAPRSGQRRARRTVGDAGWSACHHPIRPPPTVPDGAHCCGTVQSMRTHAHQRDDALPWQDTCGAPLRRTVSPALPRVGVAAPCGAGPRGSGSRSETASGKAGWRPTPASTRAMGATSDPPACSTCCWLSGPYASVSARTGSAPEGQAAQQQGTHGNEAGDAGAMAAPGIFAAAGHPAGSRHRLADPRLP